MAKRRSQEAEFLARREERIEENEAQLQHLRRLNMEDFNKTKIGLEIDIQNLQQQIQQMKATYLLNAEKLEYNFQVSRSPCMCVCVRECELLLLTPDNLSHIHAKIHTYLYTKHCVTLPAHTCILHATIDVDHISSPL